MNCDATLPLEQDRAETAREIVKVVARPYGDGSMVSVCCPWCFGVHAHGNPWAYPPGSALRVPHCTKAPAGAEYQLVMRRGSRQVRRVVRVRARVA